MAWVSLIIAGLSEAFGVFMISKLHEKKNVVSLLLLIVGFGASFYFLAYAMQFLPMGTSYAIWTGMGATGGALIGMIFYNESKDWRRIVCIAFIISSAVGLKLVSE